MNQQFQHGLAPVVIVESMFGPLLAFVDDHATRQILAYGAHTRNEIAMLQTFLDAGDLVYDIGAHIGTFAVPFAKAVGEQGCVVSIEADPSNYLLLCHNIVRHGLIGHVAPVCAVAGGTARRYRATRALNHTSATYYVPDTDGEAHMALDIDALHSVFGRGRRASLLKVDVEGMELPVLRSAQALIASDRPLLYVEIAAGRREEHGTTVPALEEFLRTRRYRFFRNVGDRNSTDDRFILAELSNLAAGGAFYDVLAIPDDHDRLERATTLVPPA